jgi:hypothetical protein
VGVRAVVLAAVAALVAGCGSSSTRLGAGAVSVPADAEAFVAVRTDAPNWQLFVRSVVGRVPKIAAGSRVLELALVGGKVVVVQRGARVVHPLADSRRYRSALGAIPQGVTGIGYLRGDLVARKLHQVPGQITITTSPIRARRVANPRPGIGLARLPYVWGAAWLTRDGIGARAHSGGIPVMQSLDARGTEQLVLPYTARLFDEIPADAVSVVDVPLPQFSFESMPVLPPQIRRLAPQLTELELGASLDTIFRGETALYTRPGGEVTVVTSPGDIAAAQRELAYLFPKRTLHVATLGGQLVISTTARGIARFRGGGPKLGATLDLPDEVTLVAYTSRYTAWGGLQGADPTLTVRFNRDSG